MYLNWCGCKHRGSWVLADYSNWKTINKKSEKRPKPYVLSRFPRTRTPATCSSSRSPWSPHCPSPSRRRSNPTSLRPRKLEKKIYVIFILCLSFCLFICLIDWLNFYSDRQFVLFSWTCRMICALVSNLVWKKKDLFEERKSSLWLLSI